MKTLEKLKKEMDDAWAAYEAVWDAARDAYEAAWDDAHDAHDTNQAVAWDAYTAAQDAYNKKLKKMKTLEELKKEMDTAKADWAAWDAYAAWAAYDAARDAYYKKLKEKK